MLEKGLTTFSEFRPAWVSFAVYFFGIVVFVGGPLINPAGPISPALGNLLATVFIAFVIVKRFTNIYRVDSRQVAHVTSFPSAKEVRVNIDQIRRIDLRRGLTQRALGVAHVWLYVEGREEAAMKIHGVQQPELLRDTLKQLGASDQTVHGAWRR